MHRGNKGFTLIELMLSMAFIAILLIAITMLTVQLSNIYNRGITLRGVDVAGRSIANQLRRDIAQQSAFEVIVDDNYIIDPSINGRLCTGQYSYVWNIGEALENDSIDLIKYSGAKASIPIKFARVLDASGEVCVKDPATSLYPDIDFDKATELVSVADKSLAIHDFSVSQIKKDALTGEALYSFSYTIGTNEQDFIDSANKQCKAPGDSGSSRREFAYCSINSFDIIVKTGSALD